MNPVCSARTAAEEALTIPVVPPTSVPLTNTRSNVCCPQRPAHSAGRTTSPSIASSKYHLLTNSRYRNPKRSIIRALVPGRLTHT